VGSKNKIFSNSKLSYLIKEVPNVFFTGYISDIELVQLYQKAKLFVYPSLYEGFGIPPLEAMACGTPVIVSNVASLPEVCEDAAYYVNPYDVNNIAEGIKTVLKDEILQKELIQKGLARVKLFSWEKSTNKLIDIINSI
jgi:glycosyltransferase involved in cell wall biosynthesis